VGSDGIHYGVRFELRLPDGWNGRLLSMGGGGLDGLVYAAVGNQGMPDSGAPETALARGYAVVSSDGGHDESLLPRPGAFGRDPQSFTDYAYGSVRAATLAAQAVVATHYEARPTRTYYMGCSTGGREGLMAAQRYPELFDGIIAGAPAFHLTRAMLAQAWNDQSFARALPGEANRRPDISVALSDADLQLVAHAVLARCDALDGVADGLVSHPAACRFNPATLACKAPGQNSCLSAPKLQALERVFGGAHDSSGRALHPGFPWDAGIASAGWRQWMLGDQRMPALNMLITDDAVNGVALRGQSPAIDIMAFDFDRDTARVDASAPELNATSTDYSALRKRGTKLLLYSGMSDPVFSASDLIQYYQSVATAAGGLATTQEFARLFLVPGMAHCMGGPALDRFDTLAALEQWVEAGKAPASLPASGNAFPGRSRPLCAYPKHAQYLGRGDTEKAESFQCRD
jgi:feruloyl esterase